MKITLLKGKHETAEDAKHGLPYIRECDVYSPECAFQSELEAVRVEDEWMLLLPQSRSRMKDLIAQSVKLNACPDFARAQKELLHRNSKPIWYTERWHQRESILSRQMHDHANLVVRKAAVASLDGRFDDYVRDFWCHWQYSKEEKTKRDTHIAHNFEIAEERIRTRYPSLREQRELHLVARLGAMHCPEQYCSKPVEVVQLPSERSPIFVEYNRVIETATSPDEARPIMLAFALQGISAKQHAGLSDSDILAMSISELERTIRALVRAEKKQAKPL